MTRRILWCWLSLLLVAALVLASCGPKEKVVEKEELYGGTLTVLVKGAKSDPASPDIAVGGGGPTRWLTPVQERPIIGDFEKYGPRGTGEYAFQLHEYIPEQYLTGNLLESWEVSQYKVVWNVRPGIMWQPGYSGIMEARELTAEDIAFDLNYFRDAPPGKAFKGMTGDIYATDRYTVVIETPDFNIGLMYIVGYEDRALISPPETHAAGADKWENQVGTGPFMLKEYVVGSKMTYERNPNYWKKTTINGVEYEIPFIDELVYPIIPDESTQIAAVRTAMVDFDIDVPPARWVELDETAPPELLSDRISSGIGHTIIFKTTEPPFDNKEVRRAMMIGLDLKSFADLHGIGPLPKHWFPTYDGDPSVYTPLEELPEETRLLFDYNPDLAKKMLADAGYPDGFKVSFYAASVLDVLERAALAKDMWSKIGVEVEIKSIESVVWRKMQTDRSYTHIINGMGEVANPLECLSRRGETGSFYNFSLWSNERFDELLGKARTELDAVERSRLLKEAAVVMLNEVNHLPTDTIPQGHFWWPWVKNYYGERAVADKNIAAILARVWIDQALKAEMGY